MPTVERQLASSKSIQTRLESLQTNVNALDAAVTNPLTGLVPTLLRTLTSHSKLAHESACASTTSSALSHLLKLEEQHSTIEGLVKCGELCEAAQTAEILDGAFEHSPPALQRSRILGQLRSRFRAVRDRAREQLEEAYSRSVIVNASEILVYPSVQVRQSAAFLQLPSILLSLDPASLSTHLDTLRRGLATHFVQVVLNQPTTCVPSSASDLSGYTHHKLGLFHSPPNDATLNSRLDALSAILDFVSSYLFPALPDNSRTTFMKSLSKTITTCLLSDLLVPNLPTSFDLLPSYLDLVQRCIDFEHRYIANLLDPAVVEPPIQTWAAGLRGHYERQRRSLILDMARIIVVARDDPTDTFLLEVDAPVSKGPPAVIVVQEVETASHDDEESTTEVNDDAEDAWGLDSNDNAEKSNDDSFDESGWGFDDDIPNEDNKVSHPETEPEVDASPSISSDYSLPSQSNTDAGATKAGDVEPDPTDAWGWNDTDDGSPPTDDSAWDDPWTDDATSEPAGHSPQTTTVPHNTPSASSPKVATRLEKFSMQKKNVNKLSTPTVSSPLASSPLGIISPPSPELPAAPSIPETAVPRTAKPSKVADSKDPEKRPPNLLPLAVIPKETFTVSTKMKRILAAVDDTLREGHDFSTATVHMPILSSAVLPSTILIQTAPEMLDLFRALYPIVFQDSLANYPARAMQFSNDCLYMSEQTERLLVDHDDVKDRLLECQRHFKVLGDSWYEDSIDKHREAVNDILVSRAEGFTQSIDQEKYDEYESALTDVLSAIRKLSQNWKSILAKSKYYTGLGQVTDAALSRVLEDILALPDITEVESHRLSELCRILNSLEALFVEDHAEHPFTAAYVPSWLKFSYLSELLEASMADITYLFEEGALVDFEIDELVRLIRALFADTPLRSATITKLQAGHPIAAS